MTPERTKELSALCTNEETASINIYRRLLKLFLPRTVASESARGEENARKFLATSPNDESVLKNWGASCACEYFDDSPGRAYDVAYKEVLRPVWESVIQKGRIAVVAKPRIDSGVNEE